MAYRKFRMDNWGLLGMYRNTRNYKKLRSSIYYWLYIDRLFLEYKWFKRARYVYKLWGRQRFNLPKRLKDDYVIPRTVKNFFVTLSYKQMRTRIKNTSLRGHGFLGNYLLKLEGRLFNIMYRTNWINNLFAIKSFIDLGLITVNNKIITYCNYFIKVGDMVHVWEPTWVEVLASDLIGRMVKKVKILPRLKSMFINYSLYFCFFWKYPSLKEYIYPITIDIYRAFDFMGPLR